MSTPEPKPPESQTSGGPTESNAWAGIAERGSLLGMRLTVWCYRTLGRRACLALVHCIVAYFFVTDRAGRRASRRYFERVWRHPEGRAALGRAPTLRDDFERYRQFGISIIDRIAMWSGSADEFEFDVHGVELVDRLAEDGDGALVLGAHLGSFDALRVLAERAKTPVNVLMFTRHAERINGIFRDLSPDAEARVIAATPGSIRSAFEIRACVERGEVVAILCDRIEAGDRGRGHTVSLLGDPVELPAAPFELAPLLGCSVFLMLGLRDGDCRYEVFTEKLAEPVRLPRAERAGRAAELLEHYASRLEHYCLKAPHQWFNFFDYWGDERSSPRGSPS